MPVIYKQSDLFNNNVHFPSSIYAPLRAWIVGPQAGLHRYAVSTEKTGISLGAVNPNINTTYSYPGQATGSIIDQTYTKLYVDSCQMQYYSDLIGSGDTIAPVNGYTNRIRAAATTFKTHGTYTRSAGVPFDVAIGDAVYLRGVVSSTNITMNTTVAGFVAENVAATVGSPTADANNQIATSATTDPLTLTQTAGTVNCVTGSGAGSASYNGLATGNPQETYTITVIQGSVGGNATTGLLRVTSASGNDNVASVTPAAFGSPTTIGTRGLTVTFTNTVSSCSGQDFVVGQTWTVTIRQTYTPPTVAAGGTYTGVSGDGTAYDTTYIVQCTLGGRFTDTTKPQITVTTTTGIDRSGVTNVTTSGTAIPIGTLGVTWTPTGTALNYGDKWYVVVTGSKNGAYQTLILANNFPTTPQNLGSATDLDLKLYVQANGVQVAQNQTNSPPNKNWTATSTTVTLNANMQGTNSRFPTNTTYPILSGTAYLEYREWLNNNNTQTVTDITNATTIPTVIGTVDPDNPLAYAVNCALANSNGNAVRYTAITDPNSQTAWQNALNLVDGLDNTYNIVPLTTNPTYLGLFTSFANTQSAEEIGLYRVVFLNLQPVTTKAVVTQATSSDGNPVLATLVQNPNVTGTAFTYLQAVNHNGKFVTNGVQVGDTVKYQFSTDGFGNQTYTAYTVAQVVNEDTLILSSGPAAAVNTAQLVEVWHPMLAQEIANNLVSQAAAYNNTRVRAMWPDTLQNGTTTIAGYYGCAMAAGLVSAIPPHQDVTHVQLVGATDVPRTYQFFSAAQLKTLDAGGVWVIGLDKPTGLLYTRHATTTNISSVNTTEEMVQRNTDAVLLLFLAQLANYIGVTNLVDNTLTQMLADARTLVSYIKQTTFVNKLGAMIIDAQITSIRPHATILDRAVITLTLTVPYPINTIQMNLVV